MSHHDNTAAWAAIIIAALFHTLVAAAYDPRPHRRPRQPHRSQSILGGPSVVALTAAALCKAASHTMPTPTTH